MILKLSDDAKKTFLAVGINFFIGAMLGVILFYGQLKHSAELRSFELVRKVSPADVFRLVRMNILWLLAIFIAKCIAPMRAAQPIMLIRGSVCGFTASYIIRSSSAAAVAAAVIPQCLTALPAMALYSALINEKRKNSVRAGKDPDSLKRRDVFVLLAFSVFSALAETAVFSALNIILF